MSAGDRDCGDDVAGYVDDRASHVENAVNARDQGDAVEGNKMVRGTKGSEQIDIVSLIEQLMPGNTSAGVTADGRDRFAQ